MKDIVLFSQVREDPQLELHCLENSRDNVNVAMIGSGGCILLTLLQSDTKIQRIDVVDSNIAQIFLIQLKIALVKHFSNSEEYIQFIEGKLPIDKSDSVFDKLSLPSVCKTYWCRNKSDLHNGINKIGKFEQLFSELRTNDFNYEKVFDRTYLESIFGTNAVVHSLNTEFHEHFRKIIATYRNCYNSSEDNYFYHQIMTGEYPANDRPLYLQPRNYNIVRNNLVNNSTEIVFHNTTLDNFLETATADYDLIHTSNLIDWMNKESATRLLTQLHNALKPGGFATLRRLNGDLHIASIVDEQIWTTTSVTNEKSHFYGESVSVQKRTTLARSIVKDGSR